MDDPENEIYKDNIPTLNYSYMSDNDFKYFIKESLIEHFSKEMTGSEKAIDYFKEHHKFKANWLKHNERIYKNWDPNYMVDNGENCYYIINKTDITYYSKQKQRMCIMDKHIYDSDKYDEYTLNNQDSFDTKIKLTKEQEDEYLSFLNKTKNDIETHEDYVEFYKNEIIKIKELSFSSNTIKAIYHICQYFFAYDENLIEYYKEHMCITWANIEKKRIEEMSLKDDN